MYLPTSTVKMYCAASMTGYTPVPDRTHALSHFFEASVPYAVVANSSRSYALSTLTLLSLENSNAVLSDGQLLVPACVHACHAWWMQRCIVDAGPVKQAAPRWLRSENKAVLWFLCFVCFPTDCLICACSVC